MRFDQVRIRACPHSRAACTLALRGACYTCAYKDLDLSHRHTLASAHTNTHTLTHSHTHKHMRTQQLTAAGDVLGTVEKGLSVFESLSVVLKDTKQALALARVVATAFEQVCETPPPQVAPVLDSVSLGSKPPLCGFNNFSQCSLR